MVACAPDSRDRMARFFFEVPDQKDATPDASAPRSATAKEVAFGNHWPEYVVSRHPPFVERRCQVCHDTEAGNAPRSDQLTGCKSCHPERFEYRRFGHGPAASGACLQCHNMHTSYQRALLRAPQALLCTKCHAAQYDSAALETYHKDIESRDCTTCHDPHGTDVPGLLVPGYAGQSVASRQAKTRGNDP